MVDGMSGAPLRGIGWPAPGSEVVCLAPRQVTEPGPGSDVRDVSI